MNKTILKIINLTEKLHLIVYQVTIAFSLFFYFVLKGATGHKFVITNEEIFYSIILFLAFVLSGLFKENKNLGVKTNKLILYLLLFFSTITLGMTLYFLYYTFTFNYGFDSGIIFILMTFFLLPIVFSWCNFYLIKKIVKGLAK